jgi:hypothetical protein
LFGGVVGEKGNPDKLSSVLYIISNQVKDFIYQFGFSIAKIIAPGNQFVFFNRFFYRHLSERMPDNFSEAIGIPGISSKEFGSLRW